MILQKRTGKFYDMVKGGDEWKRIGRESTDKWYKRIQGTIYRFSAIHISHKILIPAMWLSLNMILHMHIPRVREDV